MNVQGMAVFGVVAGMLLLAYGAQSSAQENVISCDASLIRTPDEAGDRVAPRDAIEQSIKEIRECIELASRPFSFTLSGPLVKLPPIAAKQTVEVPLKFTSAVNQSFEVKNGVIVGSSQHYDFATGIFTAPSGGIYAISLFGRVNGFNNSDDGDKDDKSDDVSNDVTIRLFVSKDSKATSEYYFIKGQGVERSSIGGSVYVSLEAGEKVQLLAGSDEVALPVQLDFLYLSVSRL